MEHPLPTTEGLVIFPKFKNIPERWNLIDAPTILNNWFKVNKISTQLSGSGRATHQIIQTLGGLSSVRCIADHNIVKLLDKISRSSTRSVDYNEIKQKTFFQDLVEKKVVEIGKEINCSKCGNKNWYSLRELDDVLTCRLCLKLLIFHPPTLVIIGHIE